MEKYKPIFEEEVKCPHCKKFLVIKKLREVIEEPVKGEYKDRVVVEKSTQKRLKDYSKR